MRSSLISPIGIDLGAKNTGVYHTQFTSGESWIESDHKGFVVVDNGKKKWSQSERRQKRHQRRSIKRRKLAKRFFLLINREFLKLPLDEQKVGNQTLREFLMGLFNRRGYTYISTEIDYNEVLEKYSDSLEKFLDEEDLTSERVEQLLFEKWESGAPLLEEPKNKKGKPKSKSFEKDINKIFKEYNKSEKEGHKARRSYFKNIKEDLKKAGLSDLYHYIGNISNFQLRFLRKYFNDEKFKRGDIWDEGRFNKLLNRYLSSWHISEKDKERLKEIREYKGLDFLAKIDPEKTIPPYEDQNNRDPQKCLTLVLKADKLDRELPGWESKYHRAFEFVDDYSLGMIEAYKRNEKARHFQLYLDSFKGHFKKRKERILRHLAQNDGDEKLEKFLENYERECKDSRYGYWGDSDRNDKVLSICGLKTGLKKHKQKESLAAILGESIDEVDVEEFKQKLETTKVDKKGRSKLKGLAKKCSELQKKYGNQLKFEWERREKQESEIEGVKNTVDQLQIDFVPKNPFSLAQIYNVLYGETNGFSSSCKYCTRDNALRMKVDDEEGGARAFRLSTTSSRPFDGVVARLLDSIAWKVTQRKVKEIVANPNVSKVEKIVIPIVIEENAFEFQESLLDLKKADKRAKDKSLKKHKSFEKELNDKWQRIEEDSKGICPYTGDPLSCGEGGNGEYDHIIPRSLTKKRFQTVLNSEANLIYSSSTGNRNKGSRNYTLNDLNKSYLKTAFGTDDISVIEGQVHKTWKRFKDDKIFFNKLSPDERRDIRHALFVQELRHDVIKKLETLNKTKVNGTQKYLASILKKKLEGKLKKKLDKCELDIRPFFVDAREASTLRELLASKYPKYKKERRQSLESHVVDAALCVVKTLDNDKYADYFETDGKIDDFDKIIPQEVSIQFLNKVHPSEKEDIGSSPLFKAGLFAERYAPVYAFKEKGEIHWRVGFSPKELIDVSKKYSDIVEESIRKFGRYKKREVESLDTILKSLNEGSYVYFDTNRMKLHKSFNENTDDNEKVFSFFNEIRYQTKKSDVCDFITDERNKVKKGSFLKGSLERKSQVKFFGEKVFHPLKEQWLPIIEHLIENKWEDKKLSEIPENAFEKFFPCTSSDREHSGVRKVFSLPLVESGGSFRLKRWNTLKSEPVWQCANSDEFNVSHFYDTGAEMRPLLHEVYRKSKNIDYLGDIDLPPEKELNLIKLNQFFEIKLPQELKEAGVMKLKISLNSKSRCRCRLTVKKDFASSVLGIDISQIKSNYKTTLKDKVLKNDLLGKIRGDILLLVSNAESVEVEYNQESSPIPVKEAIYQSWAL